MSELESIIKRRDDIAKKIAKLNDLIKEDEELAVAQRVLERMTGAKPQEQKTSIVAGLAKGSETTIYEMLEIMGPMDVDVLKPLVPKLTEDSYKSILSRMKSKGLIERKGSVVSIKSANNSEGVFS